MIKAIIKRKKQKRKNKVAEVITKYNEDNKDTIVNTNIKGIPTLILS